MDEVDDVDLVVERAAGWIRAKRLWRPACAPTSSGRAGGCRSCAARTPPPAVGDGGLAAAVARAAGGDGVRQQDGIPDTKSAVTPVYWKTRSSCDR